MKRNKIKRNYKTTTSTELDYMRVIKISVGVLIVFVLVLLGSKLAMGEIKLGKKSNNEEKVTKIDYQEIIVGEMFNRKNNEYYVLAYNFSDSYASYYKSLINNYQLSSSMPFYIVDLDKKINIEYASNSLNINEPTLIKISDSKITDKIVGKDNIIDFFN